MVLSIRKVLISDKVAACCQEVLLKEKICVDYKPGISKDELKAIIKVTFLLNFKVTSVFLSKNSENELLEKFVSIQLKFFKCFFAEPLLQKPSCYCLTWHFTSRLISRTLSSIYFERHYSEIITSEKLLNVPSMSDHYQMTTRSNYVIQISYQETQFT